MTILQSGEVVAVGPFRLRSRAASGVVRDERIAGRTGVRAGDAELPAMVAGALTGAGLRAVGSVVVDQVAGRAGGAIDAEVRAPVTGERQLLLEVDATGVLRWHSPVRTASTERSGEVDVFSVPVRRVPVPGEAAERGLVAVGVRFTLHLLRFPVEAVARAAGGAMVAAWERAHRGYGLGLGDTVLEPIEGRSLTAEQWSRLAGGPVLLFVHGTFSRARATFKDLAGDRPLMNEFLMRYRERVLVFDHPTLHVPPGDNVKWLLSRIPDGVSLTVDVVAHSRGGLVARSLCGATGPVRVRKLVHVGTPNGGTPLADPDHLGTFIDAASNAFALAADDAVAVPFAAVVEVAKQLATGVVSGLDGLSAMRPGGAFLMGLNADAARTVAIASDFEAPAGASLTVRAVDAVADAVFGEANDLVVPTSGAFVVPDPVVLTGVAHTSFFREPPVRSLIASVCDG